MFKKAVFLAALIMALSFGSAFAQLGQIDSLAPGVGGVPGPTQMSVNPGGLGDVLLYGYYNVRTQDNIFTVTNTSAVSGARVRIRFREAATIASQCNGSQEVLDFDICLSKGDMWTGRIFTGSDGAGWLKSLDNDTYVQTSGTADGNGTIVLFRDQFPNGVPFKYGDKNTVSDITADQTREGYFEIIAQRAMRDCTALDITNHTCTCGNVTDVLDVDGVGQDVDNVLMGITYMVNLGDPQTYAYTATAIADFTHLDITPSLGIGSVQPDLKDSDDATLGLGFRSIVPANYVLTKNELKGIYELSPVLHGNTTYIVTFPTKWATHDEDGESDATTCTDTADIFDDPSVQITIWDDKENTDTSSTCEFSPCPPGTGNTLPNEVNVVNIQDSSIFTSDVAKAISFQTQAFNFGWININLYAKSAGVAAGVVGTGTEHKTVFNGQTTFGLPVMGYQLMKFGTSGRETHLLPLMYNANAGPNAVADSDDE
jgi:hypothetical protein